MSRCLVVFGFGRAWPSCCPFWSSFVRFVIWFLLLVSALVIQFNSHGFQSKSFKFLSKFFCCWFSRKIASLSDALLSVLFRSLTLYCGIIDFALSLWTLSISPVFFLNFHDNLSYNYFCVQKDFRINYFVRPKIVVWCSVNLICSLIYQCDGTKFSI